jgi:hypothetical protein
MIRVVALIVGIALLSGCKGTSGAELELIEEAKLSVPGSTLVDRRTSDESIMAPAQYFRTYQSFIPFVEVVRFYNDALKKFGWQGNQPDYASLDPAIERSAWQKGDLTIVVVKHVRKPGFPPLAAPGFTVVVTKQKEEWR